MTEDLTAMMSRMHYEYRGKPLSGYVQGFVTGLLALDAVFDQPRPASFAYAVADPMALARFHEGRAEASELVGFVGHAGPEAESCLRGAIAYLRDAARTGNNSLGAWFIKLGTVENTVLVAVSGFAGPRANRRFATEIGRYLLREIHAIDMAAGDDTSE